MTVESTGEKRFVAIAIDGPAGAGKTTLAKALAKQLGYVYVDTGALYRAFAVHKLWLEKEEGRMPTNKTALNTFSLDFERDENGEQRLLLWGEDITSKLRTPEVSMAASVASSDPTVRVALLELQRRQAYAYNVVMEGRDIGTVILPDAEVKIFLTASLSVRAQRRYLELLAKGGSADYCTVMEDVRVRDWQDSTRQVAPLKPACDSVQLDNTTMTIEETVDQALQIIKLKRCEV